jgi:hypothetical protein
MNDRERLDMWNAVCVKKGWAKKYELDSWLLSVGVKFTAAGSVVPDQMYALDNKYNTELQVRGVNGEHLATLVLQALTGMLMFSSKEIEETFWNETRDRFKEEFEVKIPALILPTYMRPTEKSKSKKNVDTIEKQPEETPKADTDTEKNNEN